VYPSDTTLSWNFGEGNPSLEKVLKTTSLRVWGTYPRALLSKAEGAEASVALESFLLKHRAWLEAEGYLHRVVIGPDCCPGAFSGEEVPAGGWNAVHRAYARWRSGARRPPLISQGFGGVLCVQACGSFVWICRRTA